MVYWQRLTWHLVRLVQNLGALPLHLNHGVCFSAHIHTLMPTWVKKHAHFSLRHAGWCRTRVLYATPDVQQTLVHEYEDACLLRSEWTALVDQACTVDWRLTDTKVEFAQLTKQQVGLAGIAALHEGDIDRQAELCLSSCMQ